MAARFGARFVPCFPDAALHYASASNDAQVVALAPAQPLLKVCLFGPESTGKTTLATRLAQHYRTAYAADYVRAYLDVTGSLGTIDDVPWIARGQLATEAVVAAQAERVLICDTTLASVALWSEVLYGATPEWVRDQALQQRYDLWLLTDIDVPFEPDRLRCFPEPAQRAWFMAECRRMLGELEVAAVLVRGSEHKRLSLACTTIDQMLR